MKDESQLNEIADEIYTMASDMIVDGQRPFAVAAVFMTIALQIYKTSLNEKDYNEMVDTISANRDKIKSLTDLNNFNGKLH